MCNRSLGCVIWPNYEVMGLQPQSGITIALEYVSYCYVNIPTFLWYSSPRLSHHTGSSANLVFDSLYPIISSLCTGSSTHLRVAHIHPRIFNFTLSCSSPRWDNLPSGHQWNPLLGLILWYMYWGQKHFSE